MCAKSSSSRPFMSLLETITDKCEDVANVIEGIILENS
jgi:uncharacterized protein Yka (UPF0111/DUF47 family)